MKDKRLAIVGTLAVVLHGVVALLHGAAHASLGIELTSTENTFIDVVIVAAPVIAAVALWTRFARAGAILLAASMSASLLFGVYHHYIAISPDHVAHLPPGELQGLFRVTALLLVVTETLAAGIGLWGRAKLAGE
jgi:hypothetical protein